MAAVTAVSISLSKCHDRSSLRSLLPISRFSLPFALNPLEPSYSKPHSLSCSAILNSVTANLSRYQPEKPRKGADILVECLERQGVETVFAYPRCASMEIHHALTRSSTIRSIHSHSEQCALFAAEGYARSSGKPGVCVAASDHGVTSLVSGLDDTMLEGVPLVVITGQLPRQVVQKEETPMRRITKHRYIVTVAKDIPRIIEEAFSLATSGRPGLVLVDFPEGIQQQIAIPNWESGESQLEQIVSLISESKKPVLHVGGGCLSSVDELNRFVSLTGIPVTSALMGLGSYPCNDDFSLQTFGMQRTLYANHALEKSDLLLALGVGFEEALPSKAKTVHINLDSSAEIESPHVSEVYVDVKLALQGMNKILEKRAEELKLDFGIWRNELEEYKQHSPLTFETPEEAIPLNYVIQVLSELTDGNAVISTGFGQRQMWAAQFYKCRKPMHWLVTRGFGEMGFGLSTAIGASFANPNEIVVYIDGDMSFLMNIPELPTVVKEKLPVKILLLNSQCDDRFYRKDVFGEKASLSPNMLKIAEACGIPATSVTRREDVRGAIQTMLETPGPYILDVIVPQQREMVR